MNLDTNNIIQQLRSYDLHVRNVPDELRYQKDILAVERELGLLVAGRRGYDIIPNVYFVEETVYRHVASGLVIDGDDKRTFEDFEAYYHYLNGDIYTDACYAYCDFTPYTEFINCNDIDLPRLQERKSFVNETIDDLRLEPTDKELDDYKVHEQIKRQCIKWIEKFDQCKSGKDIAEIANKYERSKTSDTVKLDFFLMNYVTSDRDSEERFHAIMEYVSSVSFNISFTASLCCVYSPETVIENYNPAGTKQSRNKRKRNLRAYIDVLHSDGFCCKSRGYFDPCTHFYCYQVVGYENDTSSWPVVAVRRYFRTFDEFAEHRKGDLRHVDLSADIKLQVELSAYETDATTILPLTMADAAKYKITKIYAGGRFYVSKEYKADGRRIGERSFSTPYFCDFVHFLKGDLSGARLLHCDGLINLPSVEGLNLQDAELQSNICERFSLPYEPLKLNMAAIGSFAYAENNEHTYLQELAQSNTDIVASEPSSVLVQSAPDQYPQQYISYVTDLHLLHRIRNANCKTRYDVIYVIDQIVRNILSETRSVLLIGGDIASDYDLYAYFIDQLARRRDALRKRVDIVITLGNHELWPFEHQDLDSTIEIYRRLVTSHGMYFIHNELLYRGGDNKLHRIAYDRLQDASETDLRKELQAAGLVIYGGMGFSGYNDEFNATQGIYRGALNREDEIRETQTFDALYHKVVPVIHDKNAIILTHMPIQDWSVDRIPQKGFVYISGHTHRNNAYDDGDYRNYANNQIGYYTNNVHIKTVSLSATYDIFADYTDGIYDISLQQYQDFLRGKHVSASVSRYSSLYMLKKNNYYCFITRTSSGKLCIMHGGTAKGLPRNDLEYYYDHMDEIIAIVERPLAQFTEIQNKVSDTIKKIGGWGTIHGCIVDIDFYNHVYVNPNGLKLTAYWAKDMINKLAYPDIPALLEAECPRLYGTYMKLLETDKSLPTVLNRTEQAGQPQPYTSTDIYKISREIRKMQRLNENILTVWYDTAIVAEKHGIEDSSVSGI